jgi:Serine aminopeptidase, S33
MADGHEWKPGNNGIGHCVHLWARAMIALRTVLCSLVMVTALGCAAGGDVTRSIPTAFVSAPQPAARLVIVLPGRADDLQRLNRSGIVAAVQSAWPDADVLLAELTLPYYLDGHAPQRLHDEVIEPARRHGYREIWLTGASMGGMGTLLYDTVYPGDVDGMVLLAPYVGNRAFLEEIVAAGGIAKWSPGPPQTMTAANWQRELWRHLQTWSRDPAKARNVWLAYGDKDRLREEMPILAPLLRPEQILVRKGGHKWTVWTPAMHAILVRATLANEKAEPKTSGSHSP